MLMLTRFRSETETETETELPARAGRADTPRGVIGAVVECIGNLSCSLYLCVCVSVCMCVCLHVCVPSYVIVVILRSRICGQKLVSFIMICQTLHTSLSHSALYIVPISLPPLLQSLSLSFSLCSRISFTGR